MKISAIVAMGNNRVIGQNNKLPWHLPADLQHFKKITMGKPIIMGRKTYESIGRPLPGRCNVIVSSNPHYTACGCVVTNSVATALQAVEYSDEVFVIGGALLFQQLLSRIERIYLTVIHSDFAGDAYFPELNSAEWREVERLDYQKDTTNPYDYSFILLERLNK